MDATVAATCDLHVIFPPQWSPLQPFLSTPSLKAYLEQHGYRVRQDDWNLSFYQWFIGSERLPKARARLRAYAEALTDTDSQFRAKCLYSLSVLEDHGRLSRLAGAVRGRDECDELSQFKACVEALQGLLAAFSAAEPVIAITTWSLSAGDILKSIESLLAFLDHRRSNPFIEFFERQISSINRAPRYFGISIIGVEQIIPGLTLGRVLKRMFPEVPVLIGGSVFSRLVEKEAGWVSKLFGSCFDYICRYEGERPMELFLRSFSPREDRTPSLAFMDGGELVLTDPSEPLDMAALPTPDFSGLPLNEYFSPGLVLPLLTTRGCYWGKCAFCYHGMIYQGRYRMRPPELIARDVELLSQRHGARHFAFNDEAVPPKLFRLLPKVIPKGRYFFTALYKFEKYFTEADFKGMYDIGFRSLYVGLETASERVQKHMRKDNTRDVMVKNLLLAHDSGIWTHAFNFFGFPTETEAEAEETIQFLIDNSEIIHSEGTGTFTFEHNAAIHRAPERFGVKAYGPMRQSVFDVYYDYEVEAGLDASAAKRMLERFNSLKRERGLYGSGTWIQREHLLLLLGRYGREELRRQLREAETAERTYSAAELLRGYELDTAKGREYFVVNRKLRSVSRTNEDAVRIINWLQPTASIADLLTAFPALEELIEPRQTPKEYP